MNKVDLAKAYQKVATELRSSNLFELIQDLKGGVDYSTFFRLSQESLQGYVVLKASTGIEKQIVEQLQLDKYYTTKKFEGYYKFFNTTTSNVPVSNILRNPYITTFLYVHLSITRTSNILSSAFKNSLEQSSDECGILFRMSSGNLPLSKFRDLMNDLENLVDSYMQLIKHTAIETQKIEEVTIEYIESGSPLDFLLKIPKELIEGLLKIVEYVADYKINRKNKLLENADKEVKLLKELNKIRKDGGIEEEDYRRIKVGIIKNTEVIISKGVFPKKMYDEYPTRYLELPGKNLELPE